MPGIHWSSGGGTGTPIQGSAVTPVEAAAEASAESPPETPAEKPVEGPTEPDSAGGPGRPTRRFRGMGLRLLMILILLPLVKALLMLAPGPIHSTLRLKATLADMRREYTFVLQLCRFDIQAVRQSVEYLDVAFGGEEPGQLQQITDEARSTLELLRGGKPDPARAKGLDRIATAYSRLTEEGERAIELARQGQRVDATRLAITTLEIRRDRELLPLVDALQVESSIALRKALDALLATSAQLALVPQVMGFEADARSLRKQTAEAMAVARFARQSQRLLGEYRRFAYSGESREKLAVAEHDFDRAFMVWEAQVAARGQGEGVMSAAAVADVGARYLAVKHTIGRLAGLEAEAARSEALRIYESHLEPLGGESLPRVLTAGFASYEARLSVLLDSVARQSRISGTLLGGVALLALSLAFICPWLISRWVVRPVIALTRATRDLAAGRGGPVSVNAGGEIAELAASFNRMAEQLAERTRELEAERARERLRHAERLASVGILASGLAHQINNPVNNILLTAEDALGEEGPDAAERWREALTASAEEAKRCERIVRGLVAFSRGEPGRKWREDANQVVRRACEFTSGPTARHDSTVELHLADEPAPILGNPIALEQALVNILRNGIQSRPRARVILCTQRVGQSVRIRVRDDGRGMDREALGRLFDPFYTTRADEGGIGLGLSVSHRIIADHGGEIRVDSRPGEGTTVTVDLPLDLPGSEDR